MKINLADKDPFDYLREQEEMKKPKHKNRIHKSHIKGKDWSGFVKRNHVQWENKKQKGNKCGK